MSRLAGHALASCVPLAALIALSTAGAPVRAQTVIYRCTDASGAVTLRNGTPCPRGTRQERRAVETVPSMNPPPSAPPPPIARPALPRVAPMPVPADATPTFAPVLPLPAANTPPAERLPPPPLFQCNTADNDSYLSDTAEPKPRCLRIGTVGIDGSQSLAAGQACSMVYDQCQRVPDTAACPAWRTRVNQAQSAWTFARGDTRAEAKAEYDRIARVIAETTCNAP